MKKLWLLIIPLLLLTYAILTKVNRVTAVSCTSIPSNGDYTINSNCAFPGSIDGIDKATNADDPNTAKLTIGSAGYLTIQPNQTVVVGSLDITTGGVISIFAGGSIGIGKPLYISDGDGDSYPGSNTTYNYLTSSSTTLIDNADTVSNWVSSDTQNTPVSQETTIKNGGTGSVKAQTVAGSGAAVDLMEYSNDTNAQAAYVTNAPNASGGTLSYTGNDIVHTFTGNGTFTVNKAISSAQVLVVAGGGGGGSYSNDPNTPQVAGGGGAGGMLIQTGRSIGAGGYPIVVGSGGPSGTDDVAGSNGGNSTFDGITAIGGGGGGSWHDVAGKNGGSGGGRSQCSVLGSGGTATQGDSNGATGYGYNGGACYYNSAGGGGGAGGAGQDGTAGGAGGVGRANSITGSSVTYAVGGAGSNTGTNGTANRGNGGAGDDDNSGGTGGSGVVIIRYPYDALQSYSESSIKTEGSYALKAIAKTGSNNMTLTRTVSPTLNLSNVNSVTFDIRSTRTGSNIKIGLHDTGGTTTEYTPNVTVANTYQSKTFDLSGVSNANKDAIDKIIITIVNDSANNTFYIDNFSSFVASASLDDTITLTTSAKDLSGATTITYWVRSSVAGSFARFQFGESASSEQTNSITINQADTWEQKTWDISGISAASRDAVTKFAFQFTGDPSGASFYFDDIYSAAGTLARRGRSTDCNDSDANKWQNINGYTDSDSDTYGTGSSTPVCSGASLPAGYASNNTDCNDGSANVFVSQTCYKDVDNDGYTLGTVNCTNNATCTSATYGGVDTNTPTSFTAGRLKPTSGSGTDCNDSNASLYQNINGYVDADSDGYTVGSLSPICSGASLPSGYSASSSGTDCLDSNSITNAGYVYTTASCYVDSDNDNYGSTTARSCIGKTDHSAATCANATYAYDGVSTVSSGNFDDDQHDCKDTDATVTDCVKSLLHFDGTDATQVFTDEVGKSWSGYGNTRELDTSAKKFGTASLYLNQVTSYSTGIATADSADWNTGSSNMTIDMWVRFASLPASGEAVFLWTQYIDSTHQITFGIVNQSGTYYAYFTAQNGSVLVDFSGANTPATNTWIHYAVVKNGSSWNIYKNGSSIASTTDTSALPDLADGADMGFNLNGRIDEFRFSKGYAQWTANFSVPTSAYPY